MQGWTELHRLEQKRFTISCLQRGELSLIKLIHIRTALGWAKASDAQTGSGSHKASQKRPLSGHADSQTPRQSKRNFHVGVDLLWLLWVWVNMNDCPDRKTTTPQPSRQIHSEPPELNTSAALLKPGIHSDPCHHRVWSGTGSCSHTFTVSCCRECVCVFLRQNFKIRVWKGLSLKKTRVGALTEPQQ